MNRQILLAPTPARLALEAEQLAEDNAALAMTPEDEMVIMAEAGELQAEVITGLDTIDRGLDISASLENIAEIIENQINVDTNTDGATMAEAQLLEVTGDLVAAGSDVTGEEIVPAMEGFVGGRISSESFRTRAAAIWAQIQAYVKRIWDAIEGFFYRLLSTIPRLRRSVAAVEAKAEELKKAGAQTQGKVSVSSSARSLQINGAYVSSEAELKKGLDGLEKAVGFVFGGNFENVINRGKAVAKVLNSYTRETSDASAKELAAAMDKMDPASPPGSSGSDKARFPGFETSTGENLLGNVTLAKKTAISDKTGATLHQLSLQRNSGVVLVPSSNAAPGKLTDVTIPALSLDGVKAMCGQLHKMLDTLEDYKRGSRATGVDRVKKDIDAASEKATAALGDGTDSGKALAESTLRAMLNFNTAFARWTEQPALRLLSSSRTSISASVVLMQKSLATYK